MSGNVLDIKRFGIDDEFEILVDFIELEFFKSELPMASNFTINEASRVLGKSVVKL